VRVHVVPAATCPRVEVGDGRSLPPPGVSMKHDAGDPTELGIARMELGPDSLGGAAECASGRMGQDRLEETWLNFGLSERSRTTATPRGRLRRDGAPWRVYPYGTQRYRAKRNKLDA
jgi:hypothetical protein